MTNNRTNVQAIEEMDEADAVTAREWLDHPDTPGWCEELIPMIAPREVSVHKLWHIRSDVELAMSVLDAADPGSMSEWAQNREVPDWFREVMVEGAASTSRFASARLVSDLGVLHEVIGEKLPSGDEE